MTEIIFINEQRIFTYFKNDGLILESEFLRRRIEINRAAELAILDNGKKFGVSSGVITKAVQPFAKATNNRRMAARAMNSIAKVRVRRLLCARSCSIISPATSRR